MLKPKELQVLRPHGQILRTGGALTPDESAPDLHRLDGRRVSLDGHPGPCEHQPVSLDLPQLPRACSAATVSGCSSSWTGFWHLLDIPSAFEMSPNACRWIYHYANGWIEITSRARLTAMNCPGG